MIVEFDFSTTVFLMYNLHFLHHEVLKFIRCTLKSTVTTTIKSYSHLLNCCDLRKHKTRGYSRSVGGHRHCSESLSTHLGQLGRLNPSYVYCA
jgi:hypothetical protein